MIVDSASKFVEMLKAELIALMNDNVNKIISGHCSSDQDYRASCATYAARKEIFEKSDMILRKMREEEDGK